MNINFSGYYHGPATFMNPTKILKYKNILSLWPLAMASKHKSSSKITFNSNVDHGVQLLSDKAVAVLEILHKILIQLGLP